MKKLPVPTEDTYREARKHPGGWVYVVDEIYQNKEGVPPEFILGAWKVDDDGNLTEVFEFNPKYRSSSKRLWQRFKHIFMFK